MRRALGKQPFVIAAGTLSPARIGVVAGGFGQHGSVVDPLLVLGKINHSLPIIHATKSRSARGERQRARPLPAVLRRAPFTAHRVKKVPFLNIG